MNVMGISRLTRPTSIRFRSDDTSKSQLEILKSRVEQTKRFLTTLNIDQWVNQDPLDAYRNIEQYLNVHLITNLEKVEFCRENGLSEDIMADNILKHTRVVFENLKKLHEYNLDEAAWEHPRKAFPDMITLGLVKHLTAAARQPFLAAVESALAALAILEENIKPENLAKLKALSQN